MRRIQCRERIPSNNSAQHLLNLAGLSCSLPVLGATTIKIMLPAILYGCAYPTVENESIDTDVRITKASEQVLQKAESIDVLIFNDDKMQKLDTYQRFDMISCSSIKVASSVGDKMMSVITNSRKERYDWTGILSRSSLEEICAELEDETETYPSMSGESRIRAGNPINLNVERLTSEIVLHSLSCRFKGKGYGDEALRNIRVYLTNVNAEFPFFTEESVQPRRLVNRGGLDMDDISNFREPESIMQELGYDLENATVYPDIRLRCYPNEVELESMGTAFTRLVIEGEVAGTKYYWPININRENDGNGISRNCRYIFDIKLSRLGQHDPDIPIETGWAEIKMEIEPWREKEDFGVRF